MKQPLLSICIPTYNRSKYLKKSIESIISQKEFLEHMVEIIISDNASEDDTKTVATFFAQKYDNILYFRNDENVQDRNFPIVLSEANGILRRLSNDTIIYEPGSLAYMCNIVKKNEKDKPFILWTNGQSKVKSELLRVDFQGFVRTASFWTTSIGCFSIWEDECVNIRNDIAGCNLLLWQVRKALELVYKKKEAIICNKLCMHIQPVEKKNISYGLYKVFYENYFTLLVPYFSDNSLIKEDRDYLEDDLLFNFFTDWCIRWEMQTGDMLYSDTENLKEAVWNQYKNKPYWNDYLKYYKKRYFQIRIRNKVKKLFGRG